MAVGAAGLQLVAQRGLGHEDVHGDGQQNGHQNTGVDLRAGEQLIQPQLGGSHAVEAGLIDVAGLGVLHGVLEVADVEHPRHKVGGHPVGHDAGQHLIDVETRLGQTRQSAPQSTCQTAAQKGQDPDDPGGDGGRGDAQGDHQRRHGGDQVLTGSADVEQARLEGHGHGETRHNQGRGPEQHIAGVDGVEAPGQLTGGIAAGAEDAGEDDSEAVPCAGEGDLFIEAAHQNDGDAAHQQTRKNGDQGRQHLFGAFLLVQSGYGMLHASSPPLLSRFAPDIYRPSSDTVVFLGSSWPTISPSYMTRMRSERLMTSSSSRDTSSTALPRSRSATSWL